MRLRIDGREIFAATGGARFDPAGRAVLFLHGAHLAPYVNTSGRRGDVRPYKVRQIPEAEYASSVCCFVHQFQTDQQTCKSRHGEAG